MNLLDKIIVSDGITTIEVCPIRELYIDGEEVAKEIVMAGGRIVKKVVGHRKIILVECDMLPAETDMSLRALLRRGGFFSVTYPDPVDGEVTDTFSITFPRSKLFTFENGRPVWFGVSLAMRAQEVV